MVRNHGRVRWRFAGSAIASMLEATATLTALDLSSNYSQYFASSGSDFARALSAGPETFGGRGMSSRCVHPEGQ